MIKTTKIHIKSAITATKTQTTLLKKELYSENADYDENAEKYNFIHQIRNDCDQNPQNFFLRKMLYSENADYDENAAERG